MAFCMGVKEVPGLEMSFDSESPAGVIWAQVFSAGWVPDSESGRKKTTEGESNPVTLIPDLAMLLTGVGVFFARIVDVTLGTLRTISIVQGRTWMSFWLGFVEVGLWLVVFSTVLYQVREVPLLGVFYALGFATGNMVGIKIERRLAFGHIILRVISRTRSLPMAEQIRSHGFAVTTFDGHGMSGPVVLLYIVCRRRDLPDLIELVRQVDEDAFYITEQAGSVSKVFRPMMPPATGWRAIMKKK